MKTKSTSLARKALAAPTFVARQPRLATGRDGDLPMHANGGNLTSTSRSSGGCRLRAINWEGKKWKGILSFVPTN